MRFLWIVLLTLAAVSCQPKNELIVGKILIDRGEGAQAVFPEREELREWVKSSLSAHGKYRFKEDAKDAKVLRVRLGASLSKNAETGRIYIATQLVGEYQGEVRQLQAESSVEFTPKQLRQTFNQGLKRNLDSMLSEVAASSDSTASAVNSLRDYVQGKSMSEGEVASSIRKVAQEKDEAAVPFLAKLLKGRNVRLAVQALQALAMIGTSDSVDAITDFAERKSPELRRHAIEAVRRIGGHKAAAWLFTLSTGHNDEQVRESARLALIDVERRLNSSASITGRTSRDFIARN